jgi:5'-nucleotidase/UDP-sugar diphosphatase
VQFSRHVRYTLHLHHTRQEAATTGITIDGIPIDEQLDRSFLITCSSYLRKAAVTWEATTARKHQLVKMSNWPKLETNLLLRDELVAYIRENGGITAESGARRDGRLRVV